MLRAFRGGRVDGDDVAVLLRLAPIGMVAAGVAEMASIGAGLVAAGGLLIGLRVIRTLVER